METATKLPAMMPAGMQGPIQELIPEGTGLVSMVILVIQPTEVVTAPMATVTAPMETARRLMVVMPLNRMAPIKAPPPSWP